jgi:hypothetical protein
MVEQYAGRGQRMQAEKAGRGEEPERHEQHPRVAADLRSCPRGVGEHGAQRSGDEDQPEV